MPLRHPLASRFAQLPLILCGPMVRRLEPELVSVWVALKEPREIVLELYTGYCSPSSDKFPEKQVAFKSVRTPSIEIGKNLHLALVTIQNLPAVPPDVLPTTITLTHGGIYSYNLLFYKTPGAPEEDENLISLGLLNEPEVLGFVKGQLPTFIVPPEKLQDLRIAHGSCRKPHGRGKDGLGILAKIMGPDFTEPNRINNPTARPHYFFHTGDQIYADDCSNFLIQHYTDAGNFLLQKVEELPYPKNPDFDSSKQGTADADFVWMQATSIALPPGRRATNFYSGFTGDQSNHLYSLAEFCAAYLFQWCDVLWPPELPTSEEVFKDRINDHPETRTYLFPLVKEGEEGEAEVPANWDTEPNNDRKTLFTVPPQNAIIKKSLEKYVTGHERKSPDEDLKERDKVLDFYSSLKAVRRVLANTPSIMSFDDHDVTDDWYLNGGWSKRALGTRLGELIIRNGLLAFALFQAWGNDPVGWADKTTGANDRKNLLDEIPKLVSSFKPLANTDKLISTTRPPQEKTFVDKFHEALGFANFDNPPVKWHCFLKIGPTRVFVLDTRTRRDFSAGLNFPPNLIGKKALAEQIPDNALPLGTELAIVVSGAPVLGLAAIESIGQPIVPRVLDVISIFKEKDEAKRIRKREAGHKRGRDSLDVEHWSLHIVGFEAMLKRCSTLKKVMFLAGDVHYGITSEMDYWKKGQPEAARFVQMVSSSLKNIRPEGQLLGILPAALTQAALQGGLNREFVNLTGIGWEDESDFEKIKLKVQTDPGQFSVARPGNIPLRITYSLAKKPVLLPLRDWPLREFPPANPNEKPRVLPKLVFSKETPEPSFRWLMNVLSDVRPDNDRYLSLSTLPPDLEIDLVENDHSSDAFEKGLERIVRRSAFFSRSHLNRTVNWYSHVAIIGFEKRETETVAIHSMFFQPKLEAPDASATGKFEQPFFRHIVSLENKPALAKPAFPLEATT